MSDKNQKNKYAWLQQMNREELESLLRGDLMSSEDGDLELINAVLDVLSVQISQEEPLNTAQSRIDFDNLYRDLTQPLYPIKDEEDQHQSTLRSGLSNRGQKIRRLLLTAAIIGILVAGAVVPVAGYPSLFHAVAHWTEEQFRLQTSTASIEEERPSEDLFHEVTAALEENQIEDPFIPSWLPDGCTLLDFVSMAPDEQGNGAFTAIYGKDGHNVTLSLTAGPQAGGSIYEKDDTPVEIYQAGGVTHYILHNRDRICAVWITSEGAECSISTDFPLEDLKFMVDSIYEEL